MDTTNLRGTRFELPRTVWKGFHLSNERMNGRIVTPLPHLDLRVINEMAQ
jgi:hypothetical protein